MDNKANVFYYKSLKSGASLGIKIPQELKDEMQRIADEKGVTLSVLTKNLLIDAVCEHNKK